MQHMYILGKTGTGKSTLLRTLLMQDIEAGRGCILLDPHGDLSCAIAHVPSVRTQRNLVYIDIADDTSVYGYNPLKSVPDHLIPLAASGLLETFRQHFGEKAWGSRMEHIFRNVLYALFEYKKGDLSDILRMLSEQDFRKEVLSKVKNPQVRYFWQVEFTKLWGSSLFEAIAPIQSKVGAFLTDPKLRRFLIDFEKPISFRSAMDEGHFVLVNLARGILGSDTSNLLAGLLLQTITLAAYSRQSAAEDKRTPCHLYLDEFEHFLTPSSASMLSEVRKVSLSVTLANQYLYQLDREVRAAVMGNVATIISFRVGPEDARILSQQFDDIDPRDFQNLPNHHMYVKMVIHGEPSRPVSGKAIYLLTN